eukprot:CAMPEP_0173294292 /NCGR_PEP_ID=MMETSP1143-20121109/13793_1 /TAXON_ID=483371 /ORGANISM="non described non described, Strain CCMP2298" /LENGTH=181 /DNA_ID=CAMNT_0014233955 /DNA_START=44 /DNA_END=589 /DNA_ORIENTATION=+
MCVAHASMAEKSGMGVEMWERGAEWRRHAAQNHATVETALVYIFSISPFAPTTPATTTFPSQCASQQLSEGSPPLQQLCTTRTRADISTPVNPATTTPAAVPGELKLTDSAGKGDGEDDGEGCSLCNTRVRNSPTCRGCCQGMRAESAEVDVEVRAEAEEEVGYVTQPAPTPAPAHAPVSG